MKGSSYVGHNARKFDMPLLENEFFRCGILLPSQSQLDTLETVRRLKIPRPHNLGRSVLGMESTCQTLTMVADAAASLLLEILKTILKFQALS